MNKNKRINLLMSSILVAGLFVGCTNQEEKSESTMNESTGTANQYTSENNDFFTSIEWLESNKDNEDLVIIDARDEKSYSKGHIPNAINIAWQSLSNVEGKGGDPGWGTLQENKALSESLSAYGITSDSKVVVYGNKGAWGEDGRIAWSLKRAGIDARVLNGGIDLYETLEYEMSKEATKVEKSEVKVEVNDDMNITTEELSAGYDTFKVIDTRDKSEYEGAQKYGEVRGGHLPGAINIDFNLFYNEDGTIKNNEEIDKIMTDNSIEKTDNIVTYCTAGIRSAHMAIVLKNAGYENVKNYDASFHEWAGDSTKEVETK